MSFRTGFESQGDRAWTWTLVTACLQLAIVMPSFEAAYSVPERLVIRRRVPGNSDDVSEIPYSDDGIEGWRGLDQQSYLDEGAVVTELDYRHMTRRLSYRRPKIVKDKRNPSEKRRPFRSFK